MSQIYNVQLVAINSMQGVHHSVEQYMQLYAYLHW